MIPKPKKRTSKGEAQRQADRVYSYYRRQVLADPDTGLVVCISCGKKFHWTALELGHFIGRSYHSTRFFNRNCHGQCSPCNRAQCGKKGFSGFGWRGKRPFGNTVLAKHKRSLIALYGPGVVDFLNRKSQEILKDSREWYCRIEAYFRGLIRINGFVEPA